MSDTKERRQTMGEREAVSRWERAGLECITVSSGIGFINGYVRLTDSHFARNLGYEAINRGVSVHGGLTYGPDADGWVGFDTGHSGDYWPTIPNKYGSDLGRENAWDLDILTAEVNRLADQLAALTSLPDPESGWDCTDAEFQALLHDARCWRRLKAARQAAQVSA